jgi:uncharacterized repeat protein (TIGR03803 family)
MRTQATISLRAMHGISGAAVICAAGILLTACGGSSASSASSSAGGAQVASTFTVGGAITGLGAATGLVLANGTDTLNVPAGATSFAMPARVADGQAYDITVKVHPTALACSVAGGTGAVSGANVDTVSVSCQRGTVYLVHSFAGGPTDGATPSVSGSLLQASDGNLYGVTFLGGAYNEGVVFEITPGGSESVLHSFAGGAADGANPGGSLIQATDGNLYGVTGAGGANGDGVLYKLTPGGGESVVYSFAGGTTDGQEPVSGVIQASDGNFYGMTVLGGASNGGVVYKLTPGGTESVLYSFADHGGPNGSLVEGSNGNFYGLLPYGRYGGFFDITPGGTLTVLYSFSGGTTDGEFPTGTPIIARDGNFYGATGGGGANSINGVIFKITPGGAESVLYSFGGGAADGEQPENGPIQASDGNLYGVTEYGGASNDGIVYEISLSGAETVLHSFSGGTTDGATPVGTLLQAANGDLYGTTYNGGANGKGTIFEIN